MDVKVSVRRRYVKDGPIEMNIITEDNKCQIASVLDKDYYGKIRFDLTLTTDEIEYVTPLLEVVKNEYEKILQDRKDKQLWI